MAPAASRILMASMTLRRGGVAALAPSPAVGRWAGGDSGKQTRKSPVEESLVEESLVEESLVEESLVEESLVEIKKRLSGELSGKDNLFIFFVGWCFLGVFNDVYVFNGVFDVNIFKPVVIFG
jgi:hypothetical protein